MSDAGGPADASQEAALLEQSAQDLYEHAPCGYLSTRPDGTLVKVNQTFLEWMGREREELLGRVRFQDLLTAGGRIYHETHYAPLLSLQGSVREIAVELVRADGSRLPVLLNSVLKTDRDGAPVVVRTTVFDATERREYERELLRARREERDAHDRTKHLQRLAELLAVSLDAAEIAAVALGELARGLEIEHARLALLNATGELEVVGSYGEAETPIEMPSALDDKRPLQENQAGEVLLPLLTGTQRTGVLLVGLTQSRDLSEGERAFLIALAGQCAQALENARLYEQEHNVALTLQRSLLAATPPRDPRLIIASRYRPADDTLEVGGDWHDALRVSRDSIALVVGDVVGKGLEAASAMGQLKSATRALAVAEHAPSDLMTHLDSFVDQIPATQMSTLIYAVVDLSSGRVRLACAGHPPPILIAADGKPALIWEGRSRPVGLSLAGSPRVETAFTPERGARLLLFTDGLVERRGESIDAGLDRLLAAIERRRGTTIDRLLDELVGELLTDAPSRDDACLLGVEFTHGARSMGNRAG